MNVSRTIRAQYRRTEELAASRRTVTLTFGQVLTKKDHCTVARAVTIARFWFSIKLKANMSDIKFKRGPDAKRAKNNILASLPSFLKI